MNPSLKHLLENADRNPTLKTAWLFANEPLVKKSNVLRVDSYQHFQVMFKEGFITFHRSVFINFQVIVDGANAIIPCGKDLFHDSGFICKIF